MLSSLATFCAPASFALNTARPTSLGTIATLMVAELLPLALGAPEVDPLLHPASRPVNRLVAAPITNNVRTLLTISISYLSILRGFRFHEWIPPLAVPCVLGSAPDGD